MWQSGVYEYDTQQRAVFVYKKSYLRLLWGGIVHAFTPERYYYCCLLLFIKAETRASLNTKRRYRNKENCGTIISYGMETPHY